ncbi:MAG: porin [Mesorhizobium sp.]|nr:porin [Mesorhizobium sp.]MBL8578071.1 porin [Mesorhizobium sp.]
MNIKSLLLGSAAALVAVSGARAADAVVIAEPEPMEYVRICDTYGAGFYYIPGTETCLKFSGYMRYDIGVGARGLEDVIDKSDFNDYVNAVAAYEAGGEEGEEPDLDDYLNTNDTYYKQARFEMRVDARQETELGTLRGYGEIRFNSSSYTDGISIAGISGVNIDPSAFFDGLYGVTTMADTVEVNQAYIELGGFRAGRTDSYFTTFTGYAGNVINDDLIGYGPFGTNQLSYTFTGGNGFSAGVALETGTGYSTFLPAPFGGIATLVAADVYAIDSYVPHVVGGIGYTAGWGGISGVVGYDSVWETWAGKVRADFNVNESLALFIMGGLKDDEDVFNYYGNWGGSWALWGGGSWRFNEKTGLNVQLSYDEIENFAAVANVEYELVNNFRITPEVSYTDNFDSDDADAWGGKLRLQYNWGS